MKDMAGEREEIPERRGGWRAEVKAMTMKGVGIVERMKEGDERHGGERGNSRKKVMCEGWG